MKLTVQGRQAYAYTGGKPFNADQPCVVLIHGALHDHSVWALQSRYLAHHGWSVLALDLPGHGRSAGPFQNLINPLPAVHRLPIGDEIGLSASRRSRDQRIRC